MADLSHFSRSGLQGGHGPLADYLVADCGANVLAAAAQGVTCLHVAAWHGHHECVLALLGSPQHDLRTLVQTRDGNGQTPLHVASANNRTEVIKALLEAGASALEEAGIYSASWRPAHDPWLLGSSPPPTHCCYLGPMHPLCPPCRTSSGPVLPSWPRTPGLRRWCRGRSSTRPLSRSTGRSSCSWRCWRADWLRSRRLVASSSRHQGGHQQQQHHHQHQQPRAECR